jgi:hypothetical protein
MRGALLPEEAAEFGRQRGAVMGQGHRVALWVWLAPPILELVAEGEDRL